MMARIAVIRLKGKFSVPPSVKTTFACLGLTRLHTCALVEDNESFRGMLQSCKDVVSFGKVEKETIALLLSKRGRGKEGKRLSATKKPEEIEKIAAEIAASGKKLSEFGLEGVFFLSPPRGGFGNRKSGVHEGGPLGKNPAISELIARMA